MPASTSAPETQDLRSEGALELEELGRCPVCGSTERNLEFELSDIVFEIVPGRWQMYRCAGCGTLYLDPRPRASSIARAYRAYYTHQAPAHDSIVRATSLPRRVRNDYLRWRFGYQRALDGAHGDGSARSHGLLGRIAMTLMPARRLRAERLLRNLAAPAPGASARLLDVGCGSGEFLARMHELGWTVTGQDVDPDAAAAARGRGIEVVLGPLPEASFPKPFDAITVHHVIEHVHDPVALLAACRPLLAPGGTLWVATPNADSFGRRRYGAFWPALDSPRHLAVFSALALDQALERAGFRERKVRGDVGFYGSVGTGAALRRRARGAGEIGAARVRVVNAVADALMLLWSPLGDDLVAVAK